MNLVTGATGHIGNVLVRDLVARGEPVRALLLPSEDPAPLAGIDVEQVEGDVLRPETLEPAMRDVQVVYHLAGLVSIMPGMAGLLHQVNVVGTQNMLHASLQARIRRFVYTSSIHAIATPPEGSVIDETLPFDPSLAWGDYDKSKAEATLEVKKAIAQGLDAVIVCPTGVIGPYDYRLSEMGMFLLSCAGQKPKVYIEGAYDFVDVRDVAKGHILACQRGQTGESYILAGSRIAVRGLIGLVEEITGAVGPHLRIPIWLAQIASRFAPVYYRLARAKPRFTPYSIHTITSNSVISQRKARRELGYSSRPPRETIADTLRWFTERGILAPAYVRSDGR
jgi:dihydroflavonol-4-reductase